MKRLCISFSRSMQIKSVLHVHPQAREAIRYQEFGVNLDLTKGTGRRRCRLG